MGDKSAKDVTVEDAMAFLSDGLQKQHWKPSTLKQYATLCLFVLTEFHDEKWKKQLRKQLRKLPRVQAHAALYEGKYVPPKRIDDFIHAALDEEWAVFYTMLFKWGLRMGEAFRITPSDVNVEENRIIVNGKGFGGFGKVRRVLVEKSTVNRVLTFAGCTREQIAGLKPIRDTDPIIRNIKDRNAEVKFKETARKIKLKNWRSLTVHSSRHSYGIDFLMKRKDQGMAALALLQRQMGHTNINITAIYLDIAGGEAQEVFDAGVQSVTH